MLHLRVGEHLVDAVDRAGRHAGGIEALDQLGRRERRGALADRAIDLVAVARAVGGGLEVGIGEPGELGAEAGLPALLMFVMLLIRARGNLKRVTRSKGFKQDMEIQIFTGALWASFVAYLVGAAFSDTQYHLFPYVLVAYTTALHNLACSLPTETGTGMKDQTEEASTELMMETELGQTECAYQSNYSHRNDSLSRRLIASN